MAHQCFTANLGKPDTADTGSGPGKATVHDGAAQPDSLEYLGRPITVLRGNADFGHGLEHALFNRLDIVFNRLARGILHYRIRINQFPDGFKGKPGIHRTRTVAGQQAEMHNLASLPRFHDKPAQGTLVNADKMLMHCAHHHQGRQRGLCFRHAPVGQDDQCTLFIHGPFRLGANTVQRLFQRSRSVRRREQRGNHPTA